MTHSIARIAVVIAISTLVGACAAPGAADFYRPTASYSVDHVCSVVCEQPGGSVLQTVMATEPADAARLITAQAEQICNASDHRSASGPRMIASQCWKQ